MLILAALLALPDDPRPAWEACVRKYVVEVARDVGAARALAVAAPLCRRERAKAAEVIGWEAVATEQDAIYTRATDLLSPKLAR